MTLLGLSRTRQCLRRAALQVLGTGQTYTQVNEDRVTMRAAPRAKGCARSAGAHAAEEIAMAEQKVFKVTEG